MNRKIALLAFVFVVMAGVLLIVLQIQRAGSRGQHIENCVKTLGLKARQRCEDLAH